MRDMDGCQKQQHVARCRHKVYSVEMWPLQQGYSEWARPPRCMNHHRYALLNKDH